jgi:hypothetical protein
VTQSDGAADATHLPAEFEVVIAGAGAVLVEDGDGGDLQCE